MANTKATGDIGEQIAVEYLENEGYSILERNAKYCGCEADIICTCTVDSNGAVVKQNSLKKNFNTLFSRNKLANKRKCKVDGLSRVVVFCEVKTRNGSEFGEGAEAVTPYKAGRYVTLAKSYIAAKLITDEDIRFDIIEVCDGKVNHIINAFTENDARYYRH